MSKRGGQKGWEASRWWEAEEELRQSKGGGQKGGGRPKKIGEKRKCSFFTVATRGVLQGCTLVLELFNGFIIDLETGDQGDASIYQL